MKGESNIIRKSIFQTAFLTACSSVLRSNDDDDDYDDDIYHDHKKVTNDDTINHDLIVCDITNVRLPLRSSSPSLVQLSTSSTSSLLSSPSSSLCYRSNNSWFLNISMLPPQLGNRIIPTMA